MRARAKGPSSVLGVKVTPKIREACTAYASGARDAVTMANMAPVLNACAAWVASIVAEPPPVR